MKTDGTCSNLKLAEALKPFGFEYDKDKRRFTHSMMEGKLFDFSAYSLEGIPKILFELGFEAGQSSTKASFRDDLRALIGIERCINCNGLIEEGCQTCQACDNRSNNWIG